MKKKIIGVVVTVILGISATSIASIEKGTDLSGVSDKTFVKTRNKCSKCSCSGYLGYKHKNGTYEGSCLNTDNYGHRCGHSPERHGLRSW